MEISALFPGLWSLSAFNFVNDFVEVCKNWSGQEADEILRFTIYIKIPILRLIMRLLLSEKQVQQKVKALARKISKDFSGHEVLLIGILKGAFIFMADLARKMTTPIKMDFVRLASYGSKTRSSGRIKFTKDLETPLRGKDVLIVEDIIDTGITLNHLYQCFQARKPRSLKVVALLDKPGRRKVNFQADYVGFQIGNHFVVGYGLDWAEKYRNLCAIYVLK